MATVMKKLRQAVQKTTSAPPRLIGLATSAWASRQLVNAYRNSQKHDEEALEREMLQTDIRKFSVVSRTGVIEVEFGQFEEEYVDCAELLKHVDNETYLKIVQATKRAVEQYADHEVLVKCVRKRLSHPRLSLRASGASNGQ